LIEPGLGGRSLFLGAFAPLRENQCWLIFVKAIATLSGLKSAVATDESGNGLSGNISLRPRCTAANSKP
jgi:hypothetical protein